MSEPTFIPPLSHSIPPPHPNLPPFPSSPTMQQPPTHTLHPMQPPPPSTEYYIPNHSTSLFPVSHELKSENIHQIPPPSTMETLHPPLPIPSPQEAAKPSLPLPSLPDGILEKDAFNEWKRSLTLHLQQNAQYQQFLPGGMYCEWLPLKDSSNGQRISTLNLNDPERLPYDTDENLFSKALTRRNAELTGFIQQLADISGKADKKVILNYGTNYESILTYIMESHNYEKKHQNILELSDFTVNNNNSEDFNSCYAKFREAVCQNLKKAGSRIKFMNDFELVEDEILSPTFEEIILLWCLEKIDRRLPILVNQTFGHKLMGDLTLKDIQDDIFERIPQLLEENRQIDTETNIPDVEDDIGSNVKLKKEESQLSSQGDAAGLDVKQEIIGDLVGHIDDISHMFSATDANGLYDEDSGEEFSTKSSASPGGGRGRKRKAPVAKGRRGRRKKIIENYSDQDGDWEPDASITSKAAPKDEAGADDAQIEESRHCEFCNGSYKSKKILLEHVRGIHKVKYTCTICHDVLNNHKMYEKHLKENHVVEFPMSYEEVAKKSKHVCRHCHQSHDTLQALRNHVLVHKQKEDMIYLEGREKASSGGNDNETDEKPAKRRRGKKLNEEKDDPWEDEYNKSANNGDIEADFADENDDFKREDQDSDKPYRCNVCGRGFTSEVRLTTHLNDHKKGPIVCEFCDRRLKNNRVLSEHIRIRHKLRFKCAPCDIFLKNQRIYEEHLKNNHPELYVGQHGLKVRSHNHVCRYCLQPQQSHDHLKMHTFRHKERGELSFIMKFPSNYVFNNLSDDEEKSLDPAIVVEPKFSDVKRGSNGSKVSVASKSKEKEMCDICGISFVNVEQHRKIHSVENLSCDICDITFQDRKLFLQHKKKHRNTQEKKASCDQCGKGFTNIYHLNKHLKKHIKVQKMGGEKLKCETCNRTFFDKKEMGSHVCKHHGCEICGVKFLRARNLKLHKRMHLGEVVYPCDLCESLFLTKKRRREHFRDYHTNNEKKYKCDICDKRFLVKTGLTNHMYTHTGEKPFKCDECGLRFTQKGNLDTHMKLHTDEMPYECHVCHARFKQSGEIKRHREVYKCGFSQDDFYSVNTQQ